MDSLPGPQGVVAVVIGPVTSGLLRPRFCLHVDAQVSLGG